MDQSQPPEKNMSDASVNKEYRVLREAIAKALRGGWAEAPDGDPTDVVFGYRNWGDMDGLADQYEQYCSLLDARGLKDVIFSHEFAKALWPDKPKYILICPECDCTFNYWEENQHEGMMQIKYCNQCGAKLKKEVDGYETVAFRHLRAMVLEKDPIAYLEENM